LKRPNNRNNFDQNPNMRNMNMNSSNQMQKQEKSNNDDSSKIDELAGDIYQIIEGKYPK